MIVEESSGVLCFAILFVLDSSVQNLPGKLTQIKRVELYHYKLDETYSHPSKSLPHQGKAQPDKSQISSYVRSWWRILV